MILLVDIGNTDTVYSLYDGNNYIITNRMSSKKKLKSIKKTIR